jgi:hypothetical protein
MGTRSTIAIRNADGTFEAIYSHWDGYLSHNGRILAENYTEEAKVRELIQLGDISSLGKEIGEQHPFDTYNLKESEKDPQWENWTKAYARDRGETDCAAKTFVSLQHLQNCFSQEFTYVFDSNTAEWSVAYGDSVDLRPLALLLVGEEA